jgi:hypothetical protein
MKKGKKQAHQNVFAFKHNKNSKLTKKIAEEPLDVLCRRCIAKLSWRVKYRKFKLRTVPGRCNVCHEKNILKAYRTWCDPCALARDLCAKCGKEPICKDTQGIDVEDQNYSSDDEEKKEDDLKGDEESKE